MLILQIAPQRSDDLYLLNNTDCFVVVDVFFITADLAIIRLGLILCTILLFAEVDNFIPPTRAIRHDFGLVIVSIGQLRYIGVNHVSIAFSLYLFNILYK